MARVTLATIADRTGLSKFAVSRALSGKSGVSEQTRQLVQAAAAELGYAREAVPDPQRLLGIVFHDADLINSELHLLIQTGFQLEAQRRGYQTRMIWTHVDHEVETFARSCLGVAMVGPHTRESLYHLRDLGIPLAHNGWINPLEPFDMAHGTDREASSAVANMLLDLGHRRIAYVHGAPRYRGRLERYYGLREVLEKHPEVEFRQMTFEAEKRFADHLAELHGSGFEPTAFYCAHDGLALTVVSELLRLGYRIPEDVTVIGFGDFAAATQISPHLTTVKTRGREIGAGLVRLLDDRIHDRVPYDLPIRLMLAGHIVTRASSGPAPSDRADKPPQSRSRAKARPELADGATAR